ncbi:MAG: hypothetical protein K0S58_2796 [Nitrospira sp.]|nr:hypothetical protein [Nitrospira sp.]
MPRTRCNAMCVNDQVYDWIDEQSQLRVGAWRWRCRPCHETVEEIWLSAGYRGPNPVRICYAVAPPLGQRQIALPACAAAGRGPHAYVGAV